MLLDKESFSCDELLNNCSHPFFDFLADNKDDTRMKAAFWRGRRLRWPARTLMFHSMGIMSVAFLGAIMGIMSGQMGAVLGSDWLPRIESVWSEGRGARGAASGGRARGGGDSGDTTSGGGPDEHKNKDSTSAGPAADEDAACDEGDEGSCAPTTTTTTIRPIPGRTRPTPTPTTPTLEQQSEPAAAPCDPTESDDEDAGCPPRDPLASIAALEKEAILSNVRHGTMEHAATASASETRTATASASERPLASSTPSSETPQTSSALQGRKESSLESAGGPEPEDSVLVTIDAEGSSTVEDSVEENGLGNAEGSSTVSEKVHDVPSDAQLYLDGLGRTKTYAKNENEQLYLDSQTAIWTKYRMAEQVAEDAEDFHTAAMNVQLRRRGGRRGPSSRGAYLEDDEEPGT